jgi:predicted nucleotidyltransferase
MSSCAHLPGDNKSFKILLNISNTGDMDKKEIERKIGEKISRFEDVDIAYIFGSFLNSEKFGDIDVAVVLTRDLIPYKRFKFAMGIARELEKEIKPRFEFDVKILNHSPVEFQHEVLKKGKVVFKRDENRRIEYETSVISTYLDFKYMYEFVDKKFLARV